jgi:3',5'-cyclic AMP phosphodiesterase CpdA
MEFFGQHPAPALSLLHLSDTHLLAGDRPLFGVLETEKKLQELFRRVSDSGLDIAAVVITGDLADLGEPGAYDKLAAIVNPWADSLGAEVVWVMGNHDDREAFSEKLLGQVPSLEPQDRVHEWQGLRLIALDTSVPGFHHGRLAANQLAWLRQQLRTPAPLGTLIAMHHPPLPAPAPLMGIIELEDQEAFWDAIAGSDVRGILAGHLHHIAFTASHGVPVSVAAGVCYTIDLLGDKDRLLVASDRGQAVSLVNIYDDQVVFSHVATEQMPEVHGFSAEFLDRIEAMPQDARREMFSNKSSPFNSSGDR